jgi:succinate dehydrogenase / fumarate reductase, membrane anchor subunit
MKESKIMLIQYATAVAAVFLVSFHLLMQGVINAGGYAGAVSFNTILSVYSSGFYAIFLESLLVVVLVHGLNGVRIILHEWRQTAPWSRWVDIGTVLAIVISVGYGTRTVILAVFGGVAG